MPTVYIDGNAYEVEAGRNMLQVVLDNKLDLPYFCWHPAMGSVGACRLCAVKVFRGESDEKGKIGMACTTPAVDGTRISVSDPEAAEFRKHVIEWLMINHPHDCPVCDEGGECHLQDMTAMTGHVYRRFTGKKRTHNNQDLGPFVNHEMNRCIQCYRCVRFYRDQAGGRDFNVFGWHDDVYFGRAEDGVLESEFSGNLVEVCPTGVFTDKTLKRHYTRKWDLETAPSVCIHCGLGCNTIAGARYGQIRRVRARCNGDVNGYFLCDRGRYGYEFANGDQRVRNCRIGQSTTSWEDATAHVKTILTDAKGVVGIGSPRASLESNYTLRKLVGGESFSTGLFSYEHEGAKLALRILRDGSIRTPSLAEVEASDVVLILSADPTNEAPMLDFAIRRAMRKAVLDVTRKLQIPDWDAVSIGFTLQDMKGKLFTAAPWSIKLEEIAMSVHHMSFSDIGGFIDSLPDDISSALKSARQPLVVTSISAGPDVLTSAARFSESIGENCRLSIIMPEANTMGVSLLGGLSVDDALARIESGDADTLVVLENDLSRRVGPERLKSIMDKAGHVIVLDCIETAVTQAADVVLPVSACFESNGTFVSSEGRAQRFFQVLVPTGEPRPSWQVLSDLGRSDYTAYEEVLRDMASENPVFSPALDAAPNAGWRSRWGQKIARQPHRFTGRTAVNADKTVFEPQSPDDTQTPFAFSMEGIQTPPPGPLVLRDWWPGWNSVQSITKFQIEVNGPLMGGNSGKRLIEPTGGKLQLPDSAKEALGDGEVWLTPHACIFGSEELSSQAQGVGQLIPLEHIAIHPETAHGLGVTEGGYLEFKVDGLSKRLMVRLDESCPPDVAAVPANLPETVGILAPVRVKLVRVE